MSKKLKKVIAMVLTVAAFATIEPSKYINLTTTVAHASVSSDALKNLEVKKGSKELQLYNNSKCKSRDEVDFKTDKTDYYVKIGSSKSVKISADLGAGYKAKVVKSGSKKEYDLDEKLSVSDGTKLKVTVYSESNKNDEETYNIKVKSTSSSSRDDDDDDEDYDDIYLDKIKLSDGDIDFSRKTSSYTVKVKESVESIKITAEPEDDDYTVKIDGKKVDEDDKYRKNVDLKKGKNEIEIKIKDDSESRTYTLNIYRGTSDAIDEDDDDNQDDVYLKNISLSDGEIDFKKRTSSYDVSVEKSVDDIRITAKPQEDDYTVKIDGRKVDDDDDYKRTVDLKEGKNEIEVMVKDGSDQRTYTLNIYRGTKPDKDTSTDTNEKAKPNQWVTVNGNFYYNDSIGNPIKNSWFIDRNLGKWYFMQADGSAAKGWLYNNSTWYYLNYGNAAMETGWSYIGGTWYYLGSNGAMETGWKYINGTWYYLNSNGSMKTGWLNDGNGRWYLLDNTGAMLANTTINGYKLGANGMWIR
ncbi:cadherin-like beta sandwich domain-containing protein [Clostridium uliginosum]|uniref:Putative cell wall binding repeat-containing protein n=1 Tax=Clostridium uliginosum TaxID=119641 RepID=A0A1I1MTC6_9CLOT|nr:cadherin-like beta sandwich domain-containing protein [Clostridium uliginosum]SFC84830.1 Putative cell wall binding repeat-containing protein [Clostridium uliginosum]